MKIITLFVGVLLIHLASSSSVLAQPAIGDTDRDGIQNSVGDLGYFGLWLLCSSETPIGPEWDTDCDGNYVSYFDWVAQRKIILRQIQPCFQTSGKAIQHSSPMILPKSSLGEYSITIDNVVLYGVDTIRVDIIMNNATEVLSGYQFQLEYNNSLLSLLEVEVDSVLFPAPYYWDWTEYNEIESVGFNRVNILANQLGYWNKDDLILPSTLCANISETKTAV